MAVRANSSQCDGGLTVPDAVLRPAPPFCLLHPLDSRPLRWGLLLTLFTDGYTEAQGGLPAASQWRSQDLDQESWAPGFTTADQGGRQRSGVGGPWEGGGGPIVWLCQLLQEFDFCPQRSHWRILRDLSLRSACGCVWNMGGRYKPGNRGALGSCR